MSGRTKTRTPLAFVLMALPLFCALLATTLGAWAQPPLREGPPEQEGATPGPEGDPAADTSAKPAAEEDATDPADAHAPRGPRAAVGDTFQQPITIGGKQVPCWFYVTRTNPNEAAIGNTKRQEDDPEIFEPAVPTDASGAVSLPVQISNGNEGYAVTAIGKFAFYTCVSITSTGLETNSTITSVGMDAFKNCSALKSTGLDFENSAIVSLGRDAFGFCVSLSSTGLGGNSKITTLGGGTFGRCSGLRTTGLETNSTVTALGTNCFDYCTSLRTTGLENPSSAVSSIDQIAFTGCDHLISTGLESNTSVSSLGQGVFGGCTSLGTEDTETADGKPAANAGDLVLNGCAGKMSIGPDAFLNTRYERVYLADGLVEPTFSEGALDIAPGRKIPVLYVQDQPPWNQRDGFVFGGTSYAKSDGSYIVMAPRVGEMSATRVVGTADSAALAITANHSVAMRLPGVRGDVVLRVPGTEDGSMQTATGVVPPGTGLAASGGHLEGSIGSFVYPVEKEARAYNSVAGATVGCKLAPVSYRIDFDSHGGTGTMDPQQVSYDPANHLIELGFSMGGMAFAHWSTDRDDAASDRVVLADGGPLESLPALEGGVVTLFAQWRLGLEVLSASPGGEPLAGAAYQLSATAEQGAAPLGGLSTDPEGRDPIGPPASPGTSWPLVSGVDGAISLYWLPEGTYYLWNTSAPAGCVAAGGPMRVDVADSDGAAVVSVDNGTVTGYGDATARVSVAFTGAPILPATGTGPRWPLRTLAALAAIGAALTLAAPFWRRWAPA